MRAFVPSRCWPVPRRDHAAAAQTSPGASLPGRFQPAPGLRPPPPPGPPANRPATQWHSTRMSLRVGASGRTQSLSPAVPDNRAGPRPPAGSVGARAGAGPHGADPAAASAAAVFNAAMAGKPRRCVPPAHRDNRRGPWTDGSVAFAMMPSESLPCRHDLANCRTCAVALEMPAGGPVRAGPAAAST